MIVCDIILFSLSFVPQKDDFIKKKSKKRLAWSYVCVVHICIFMDLPLFVGCGMLMMAGFPLLACLLSNHRPYYHNHFDLDVSPPCRCSSAHQQRNFYWYILHTTYVWYSILLSSVFFFQVLLFRFLISIHNVSNQQHNVTVVLT